MNASNNNYWVVLLVLLVLLLPSTTSTTSTTSTISAFSTSSITSCTSNARVVLVRVEINTLSDPESPWRASAEEVSKHSEHSKPGRRGEGGGTKRLPLYDFLRFFLVPQTFFGRSLCCSRLFSVVLGSSRRSVRWSS